MEVNELLKIVLVSLILISGKGVPELTAMKTQEYSTLGECATQEGVYTDIINNVPVIVIRKCLIEDK